MTLLRPFLVAQGVGRPRRAVTLAPSARRYSTSRGGWCTSNSQPSVTRRSAIHSMVSVWLRSRQVC